MKMNEIKQQTDTNEKEQIKNDLGKMLLVKNRKGKMKKIVKKVAIIAVIIAIFAYFKFAPKKQTMEDEFNFEEKVAEIGSVNVTVEGDGTIIANSIYHITPKVTGEILSDNVVLNEYVNKGDVLYVIDSKDIDSTINQASLGIDQSNVALEQAQSNYNTVQDQINDLKIYATADGYIENLKIDNGTFVNSMTQICNINEKNTYEVTLQFRTSNAKDIAIGNRASLFYKDYFTTIDGVVSKISDSTGLQNNGAQATDVTIKVETTGYNIQNARVSGTIYTTTGLTLTSMNEGYVNVINSDVVVANSSGVVKELYVDNGSYVHKGDLIAILENTNLNTQLDSAGISIKNAQVSKKNAQNGLETTKKQLDNYVITSPITGKVVYKNNKKGDVISSYQQTTNNIMATIADTSVMKFEMQVDELDISKIKVGQEVIVSVEALDNKEFIGKVANINTIGNSVAGMTNYTVLIEIPENDEIYSGMTVDGKIKIVEKDNVLRVPLMAVRKGDVVYKKVADTEYQDDDIQVPKGYEKVKVEIGLNNDEYIEILSGLSSGDIVLIDKVNDSGTLEMEKLRNMMMEN